MSRQCWLRPFLKTFRLVIRVVVLIQTHSVLRILVIPLVQTRTFNAVNNIIETITQKFEIEGHSSLLPEFHVYFNDHVSNDFNILFSNLPQNRQYYADGVRSGFISWKIVS